MLRLTRYQGTVLFAAWVNWGFDIFDKLLFNYVAPNAVPTLLGLPISSVAAKSATLLWRGILTSVLLIGWVSGGMLFAQVCDHCEHTKTLLLTMLCKVHLVFYSWLDLCDSWELRLCLG